MRALPTGIDGSAWPGSEDEICFANPFGFDFLSRGRGPPTGRAAARRPLGLRTRSGSDGIDLERFVAAFLAYVTLPPLCG